MFFLRRLWIWIWMLLMRVVLISWVSIWRSCFGWCIIFWRCRVVMRRWSCCDWMGCSSDLMCLVCLCLSSEFRFICGSKWIMLCICLRFFCIRSWGRGLLRRSCVSLFSGFWSGCWRNMIMIVVLCGRGFFGRCCCRLVFCFCLRSWFLFVSWSCFGFRSWFLRILLGLFWWKICMRRWCCRLLWRIFCRLWRRLWCRGSIIFIGIVWLCIIVILICICWLRVFLLIGVRSIVIVVGVVVLVLVFWS